VSMNLSSPAHVVRATMMSYGQSALYSVTLGIALLLVPFYIRDLGYNLAWLGLIIAAQGVFQLGLRLFGGVLADRIGERWIIAASFACLILGSCLLAISENLAIIVGSQLLFGASRAVYWTPAQSYGSRIREGDPGRFMGRFFGFSSAGQLAGAGVGGWLAQFATYPVGFSVCALLGVVSLVSVIAMPDLPRKSSRSIREILAPIPAMIRSKITVLPAIAALGTSISMSLVSSMLPAFFREEMGFQEGTVGILRIIHGVGAILVGFAFSMLLTRLGQQKFFTAIVVGNGLFLVGLVGAGNVIWLSSIVMLWLGMSFNAGRVIYAAMTAELSRPDERGVAMAVLGLYWAAGQLIGPAVFGLVAWIVGLEWMVVIAGLTLMAPGLLSPFIYRSLWLSTADSGAE